MLIIWLYTFAHLRNTVSCEMHVATLLFSLKPPIYGNFHQRKGIKNEFNLLFFIYLNINTPQ